MLSHFDTILACDRQTNRDMDRQYLCIVGITS